MTQLMTAGRGGLTRQQEDLSVGEEMSMAVRGAAEEGFRGALADMAVFGHRDRRKQAQRRLDAILGDFGEMIENTKAAYTQGGAVLCRLSILGMREQLIDCYRSVQPGATDTVEASKAIIGLVDQVIAEYIAKLEATDPNVQPRKPDGQFAEKLSKSGSPSPRGK